MTHDESLAEAKRIYDEGVADHETFAAACRAIQAERDALKAENAALKAENVVLKARIKELEDQLNPPTTQPTTPPPTTPPVTPPPPILEIVIDDGQPGTSKTGSWTTSEGANPFGTKSLYSKDVNSTYTWARAIPAQRAYNVFVWWTHWPSRDRQVPYVISAVGGPVTVLRDQQAGGGQWQPLGRHTFQSELKVMVRVPGTATVCADAVRFVPA
jgi:hypothetical protein